MPRYVTWPRRNRGPARLPWGCVVTAGFRLQAAAVVLAALCLGREVCGAWPMDAPNPPPEIDPRLVAALPTSLDQVMAGTPSGLRLLADAAYGFGAAVDASGDVYFTEFANQRLQRYRPTDGLLTTVVGDRPCLYGVAVDRQGNLFYAQDSDAGTGRIVRRSPSGSEQVVCSGLTRPRQLTTDAEGNLYAVLETREILKWQKTTGTVQSIVTPLQIPSSSPPQGVAVGGDGRVFFSTYGTTGSAGVALQPGAVWVRETNGSITQIAGGLWRTRGLAAHPNGKLYAVTEANAWDQGNSGLLVEINPVTKNSKRLLSGVDYAQFPAVGPDGQIYVTAARDGKLMAYDPAHQFVSQAIADAGLELSVEKASWRETVGPGAFPLNLRVDSITVDGYLTFSEGAGAASMWFRLPAERVPGFTPVHASAPGPGFFSTPPVTVDWRYGQARAFTMAVRDHVRCRWPMTNVGTVNESPQPDFSETPEAYLVYVDVTAPTNVAANRWKGGGAWTSEAAWSSGTAPDAVSGETWVEPASVWRGSGFPVVRTAGNSVQNLVLGDAGEGSSLRLEGGTLDATGSIRLGEHYDATVDVISGRLSVAGDLSLSTSHGRGAGTVNVRDGTVSVAGQILLGWDANAGTLNIAGGSVESRGVLIFNLDGGNTGAAEARVNLYGGTLTIGSLSINTLDPARLDITDGRLVLPASSLGNVNFWIQSGHITALDGRRAVDVTPAAGDRIVCTARRLPTDVVFDVASGVWTQAQAGHAAIAAATWVSKTGTGEVVFDSANAFPGVTTVTAGRLRIAHPAALAGSESVIITGGEIALPSDRPLDASIRGLSINEALGGRLDIGAGRINVAAGGITAADLLADLHAGRNGGTWDGTAGLSSAAVSTAIASNRPRTIGWFADGDGSFTIGAAAPGDTNIDGIVDVLDVAGILAGGMFGTGLPADWSRGDANYDGFVDVLDIAELLAAGLFGTGAYAVAFAAPVAMVPEPIFCPVVGVIIVSSLRFINLRSRDRGRCRRPDGPFG